MNTSKPPWFWVLLCALTLWTCSEQNPVSTPTAPPVFDDLRIVSGNNQIGRPGDRLRQPLRVQAIDNRGSQMRGIRVHFEVTAGSGVLSATEIHTDTNGYAQTYLTLGSSSGTHRVAASVSGLKGLPPTFTAIAEGEVVDAPLIIGPPQVPVAVELMLSDTVLVADGARTAQVTATVRDSLGNGVPNATVRFTVGAGSIDAAAVTDATGRAEVTYASPANPAGIQQVTVSAHTAGLNADAQLTLLGVRLRLMADRDTLAADGISQTTITAILTDDVGAPLPFVPVDFGATLGGLTETQVETDVTGRAAVIFQSVMSPTDLPQITVRATASGLNASLSLTLLGAAIDMAVSADTISADGNAQAKVRVQIQRSDGQPLVDETVHFETSLGALSSTTAQTDAEGVAETILVAGTEAGRAVVTVTYGAGLSVSAPIAFVKGPPASIVLISVDPPSIGVRSAGANETAIVTMEVRDARGNTVADGEPVFFRLDAPGAGDEQVGPERTETVNGRVQAAVRSGTVARTIRLIAEIPNRGVQSIPVPIAIHGGPPDRAHFSVAPDRVNLAGRVRFGLTDTLRAFVFDKYSNPVPEGTSVRFRTDGGGIQGSGETNANGQARVVLFTAAPIPLGPDFLATITGQTVDENGVEIETTTTVLFSGPTAPIVLSSTGADTIMSGRMFIPDSGSQLITFTVSDIDGKPLMGGSEIQVTSDVARISGDAKVIIPDARSGHTEYAIIVSDPRPREDPPEPPREGSVLIQVRSINGDRQLTFGLTVD